MFTMRSTRYMLPLLCILAITIASDMDANEVSKSDILSHNIEIELFLKEHRLKAVDHVLLPCTNAEKVSFFVLMGLATGLWQYFLDRTKSC